MSFPESRWCVPGLFARLHRPRPSVECIVAYFRGLATCDFDGKALRIWRLPSKSTSFLGDDFASLRYCRHASKLHHHRLSTPQCFLHGRPTYEKTGQTQTHSSRRACISCYTSTMITCKSAQHCRRCMVQLVVSLSLRWRGHEFEPKPSSENAEKFPAKKK